MSDKPTKVTSHNAEKAALKATGFAVKDIPVASAEYEKKISASNAAVNMGQDAPAWCHDLPTGDSVNPSGSPEAGRRPDTLASSRIPRSGNRSLALAL